MAWSTDSSVQGEGRTSGSTLREASFGRTRCGVRLSTFDVEIDCGGAGVVAHVGGFWDEDWIGDVNTTGTPFLDCANLGTLPAEGLTTGEPWGFEIFGQGLELAFRLIDHVLDLFSPGSRVVKGVNHLFECEREA